MSPIGTDDFWEDLLDFIEQGKVIPVIGEHAVTFGEGNEPLFPWLARLHAVCDPGGRLTMPPKLETLLQYARAERFIPFTIIFSSGTNYPIQNRDLISVPPPDKTDEGNQYADYFIVMTPKSHRVVWLDSVAALEANQPIEDRD